jgi:N utilization substance protein A
VGVRGNRIRNIVDELHGERIDIVRWNDDMQVLIPNALQPAAVDEVILCKMIGRAIVLVREDQLSLAIGRRGQNVRLASKLCGWDIEIMTQEELQEQIERAVAGFSSITGVADELAERLVGEGFLSYDDLSVIEPDDLMEMGELTAEQVDQIVAEAEERAEQAEQAAAAERRRIKQEAAASESSGEEVDGPEFSPVAAGQESDAQDLPEDQPEGDAQSVAESGASAPLGGHSEGKSPESEAPGGVDSAEATGPSSGLEDPSSQDGDTGPEGEVDLAEDSDDADRRRASPHTNQSVERD